MCVSVYVFLQFKTLNTEFSGKRSQTIHKCDSAQVLYYFIFENILLQVPNSAIKECTNYTDFTGKEFMNPVIDKTVKADTNKEQQTS